MGSISTNMTVCGPSERQDQPGIPAMFIHVFFFFVFALKTCAGHSLYLPGGSRPQYGRHIYVHPSQDSNSRPRDQAAKALTTELWRRTTLSHECGKLF